MGEQNYGLRCGSLVANGNFRLTTCAYLHIIITLSPSNSHFDFKSPTEYSSSNLTKRTELFKMKRKSLHSDRKKKRERCRQYVVCPRCTKLYLMDDIVVNDCRQTFARTCEHVAFPQSRRPRTCGSQLARKVVVRNGGIKFYALKTYC